MYRKVLTDRSLKLLGVLIIAVLLFGVAPFSYASNFLLTNRTDYVSNPKANAVSTHDFSFKVTQLGAPIGSIRFMFCSNSPIVGDACVAPAGLDASSATLDYQIGDTGFTIGAGSTASQIVLTRPAQLPSGGSSEYRFINIINPSAEGSYYVRLETFTSTDATGLNIEQGGVVFVITPSFTVTSIVPPYLKFCASVTISAYDCSTATSYFIDMGEFTATKAATASSELLVATNAGFGFSVSVTGTTMTSGNNVIPALVVNDASNPGTSQFGMNLRANTSPGIGVDPSGPGAAAVAPSYNIPNLFRFQNGDTIITSTGTSDNKKFTLSYVTNINSAQPAGYYTTTLTYICLANF